MDLKTDYENLYQHWVNEFQQSELTKLDQHLFDYYKKIVSFINNYKEEQKQELKQQVFESYKANINYIFNDLLKIRERKIINCALMLKEIDLDAVIESEKLLYQNLISSIKGYKKIKASAIYSEIKSSEDLEPLESKSDEKISVENTSLSIKEENFIISDKSSGKKKEEIKYIVVRFLKKTPPLVGIDLLNYGPFDKEDIAFLPYQNAIILVNEKFAEKIEFS
ncbi:MAG: hypothetical protein ACFFHD_09015 [Promethearchaeota archaeon]